MKIKTFCILIGLAAASLAAPAQDKPLPGVEWNGYTQLRMTTDFRQVHSFSLRRLKFWLQSTPGFNDHWGFRLQTTLSSNQNEKFFLQDATVFYRTGGFTLHAGQFVPHYSLERFQSDYAIPLAERSDVINTLIPNGTLGVRDLGTELSFHPRNGSWQAWLGVFNGYGINEYHLNNAGFLLTQKTSLYLSNKKWEAGYSVMYRKAGGLKLTRILPDSVLFTGNDFRGNLFARYSAGSFQFQAEYLIALLNGQTASGWYAMAQAGLGKGILALSVNQYRDLIGLTDDSPSVHLAYVYRIKGENLQILFDNGIQATPGRLKNYSAVLQLQLFFN